MSEWIILSASAAVVALMVIVAALLGFRERLTLTEADLARLAREEGDVVESTLVGARGSVGAARLASGKLLIARVMGDGVGARIVNADSVRAKRVRAGVRVMLVDLGFPPMLIRVKGDPPAWLMNLGASR